MDPIRFDRLAMTVGRRTTRRTTGGLLAALGLTGLARGGRRGLRQSWREVHACHRGPLLLGDLQEEAVPLPAAHLLSVLRW